MKAGHTTENIGAKLRLNEDDTLSLYLTLTEYQLEKFILSSGRVPQGLPHNIFIEVKKDDDEE